MGESEGGISTGGARLGPRYCPTKTDEAGAGAGAGAPRRLGRLRQLTCRTPPVRPVSRGLWQQSRPSAQSTHGRAWAVGQL
nr:hypothetical protein CFP56_07672 [Quercus suber]